MLMQLISPVSLLLGSHEEKKQELAMIWILSCGWQTIKINEIVYHALYLTAYAGEIHNPKDLRYVLMKYIHT